MFLLTTENSFDAAHFLAGYQGKCANLHGLRWRVVVDINGEQLEAQGQLRGMLMDFGDIKEEVKRVTDAFDHSFIYETGTLREKTLEAMREEGFLMHEVAFRPTAENFAKYFYLQLKQMEYPVCKVTVYETPNNCAAYYEQGRRKIDG